MTNLLLNALAPELFITGIGCIILLADVFATNPNKSSSYWLSLFALVATAIITIFTLPLTSYSIFNGSFIIDRFACGFKIILYVLLAAIFIYSRFYMRAREFFVGEFFTLSLFSLLGMMIVISSGNFLTLYLGLELFVLPLYALIVFVKQEAKYTEAAIKYFVIGTLGSGLLLYGISLIYGATGTIDFSAIALSTNNAPLLMLGMLFVVVGVALEFGAVPFHMWLPDVYEGSPTTVTMIVGTIPKIAVFAMAYRLLTLAFINIAPALQQLFMLMALASVAIGNVMAIAQANIKRMLAYSTISHIGFILLGLFAAPVAGYLPAIFYTIVYAFMVLAAFAMIMRLTDKGFEADKIADFRGLNKRDPWLAFIMLLIMFSLAGIPPLVGFYAKLQILQAVVDAGYPWLAAGALVFTVIGAFYYLRVIRVMYFEEPQQLVPYSHSMSIVGKVLISGHGLLLLLLGVFPAAVIYLCIAMLK